MWITTRPPLAALAAALCVLTAAPAAQACSYPVAEAAWVLQNDLDRDGKLNWGEWQKASVPDLFELDFKPGSRADFDRLDTDGDGLLGFPDLSGHIRYTRDPCEGWSPNGPTS